MWGLDPGPHPAIEDVLGAGALGESGFEFWVWGLGGWGLGLRVLVLGFEDFI